MKQLLLVTAEGLLKGLLPETSASLADEWARTFYGQVVPVEVLSPVDLEQEIADDFSNTEGEVPFEDDD